MRSKPAGMFLAIILGLLASTETSAASGVSYGLKLGPSTSGKTLVSETARLEKGQKIEEILLERLEARRELDL